MTGATPAPDSPNGGPEAGHLPIRHQLTVAHIPGGVGHIEMNEPGDHVAKVLVHFVLDGRLLVIPLNRVGVDAPEVHSKESDVGSKKVVYRGVFPMPRESLEYRFQIIRDSGASELSGPFRAVSGCGTELNGATAAPESHAENRRTSERMGRLRQADLLDDDVRLLNELDEWLNSDSARTSSSEKSKPES